MPQSDMTRTSERWEIITTRIRALRALRHRNFRLLWLDMLVRSLVMGIQQVALGWLVLDLTNSPFMLGLIASTRGLPLLLFGAVGGAVADRVDRRRLLIGAAGVMTPLSLVMAILITTALIQVWHIAVIALILGTVSAFSMPTRQAFIFDLVGKEYLTNAIALDHIARSITRIIGPSLGGILIGLIGVSGCYYTVAVGYGLAVGVLFLIQPVERISTAKRESLWRTLIEGFGYVRSHTTVLALLGMEVLLDIFAFPYILLMPVFARDILGVGASGLGFLTGAAGVGALVGSLGIASMGDFRRKGMVLLGSAVGFGIVLIPFSLSPWYSVSVALLMGAGAMVTVYDVLMVTLLQTIVPDEIRGRIMGVYSLVVSSVHLGSLQMGALASLLGAPLAVSFGGAIVGLSGLGLAKARPELRRLG